MKGLDAIAVPVLASERRSILCTKCCVRMTHTTVAGISIEKCPVCEGIFFDKGEVEKLIRKNLRFERFKAFRRFRWT